MINHLDVSERINTKDISDWFKYDMSIVVNKFDEDAVLDFGGKFAYAQNSGQDLVTIIIDSFGGDVYSALAMSDIINSSEIPVATIAMGKAMSAGAILLTCGDEGLRYASPNSTIMIHDVSFGVKGKMEEIKTDAAEGERINKLMFGLMERNCGIKKGTLLEKLRKKHNSTDWYITPKQAKQLNIINHIKVPKLITTISVESELI